MNRWELPNIRVVTHSVVCVYDYMGVLYTYRREMGLDLDIIWVFELFLDTRDQF